MRFLGFLALAFFAVVGAARAQDAPDAGTGSEESVADFDVESAARARAEFEAGIEHFRAGRYRDAIHSFQVAASLTPSPDISYNIARAYEELARRDGQPADYDEAIAYYRRYLSDRVDPPDRADVEAHIAELEERVASVRAALVTRPTTGVLVVRSERDGATVEVDGESVGSTPIDHDIELEPGHHRLRAELDGYVPFEAEVTIEAGVRTGSSIELIPATHHRAIHGEPIVAWVAFGLAGAALVGSIVIGAVAASEQSAALSPFDMGRLESARGLGGWSDAALGGAIGLATVGIVLFFAESAAVGTETTTGPDGAPASVGAVDDLEAHGGDAERTEGAGVDGVARGDAGDEGASSGDASEPAPATP